MNDQGGSRAASPVHMTTEERIRILDAVLELCRQEEAEWQALGLHYEQWQLHRSARFYQLAECARECRAILAETHDA